MIGLPIRSRDLRSQVMQENILNAFTEQAKSFYTPINKFNSLFVENVEKITELQLNAIKSYAEMGIGQLKKAAEIKDADTVRAFTTAQVEAASALNKKVMDDAKAFSELAIEFKNQVEAIVEDARNTATTQAKPAAKKPAQAV